MIALIATTAVLTLFLAREVRRGMEVLVLRDAQGAPLWPAAGPGCRARHHRTHH